MDILWKHFPGWCTFLERQAARESQSDSTEYCHAGTVIKLNYIYNAAQYYSHVCHEIRFLLSHFSPPFISLWWEQSKDKWRLPVVARGQYQSPLLIIILTGLCVRIHLCVSLIWFKYHLSHLFLNDFFFITCSLFQKEKVIYLLPPAHPSFLHHHRRTAGCSISLLMKLGSPCFAVSWWVKRNMSLTYKRSIYVLK